jgi:hypothetical protein
MDVGLTPEEEVRQALLHALELLTRHVAVLDDEKARACAQIRKALKRIEEAAA